MKRPDPAGLVVDASVAVKWLIDEPGSDAALALRGRDLAAAPHVRTEVSNALWKAVARKLLASAEALDLLSLLQQVPVVLAPTDPALERRALEMALDLGRPIYDCLYLALAQRTGRLLVTADARFLRALRATAYAPLAVALEDLAG